MEEPRKPILDCLLYRWFGIETSLYKVYWKKYCNYMQYLLVRNGKTA